MNQNDLMFRRRLMMPSGANFDKVKATFSVSGGMEDTTVTVDGVTYRLLKITKSGTLTFDKKANVSICLVGGGGNGATASSYAGGGGGGGFMTHVLDAGKVQSLTFSVGSATQATTVSGDANGTANGGGNGSGMATGGSGGSGGGCGGEMNANMKAGTGDGKSKYPFGIESLLAHCAGGGGGNYYYIEILEYDEYGVVVYYNETGRKGGNGGTSGGNGSKVAGSIGSSAQTQQGGTGGTYGGGNGGQAFWNASYGKGSAGTFYGAGGGGGGFYGSYDPFYGSSDVIRSAGGSGYQGVAYVIDGSFPANV